MGSRSSSLSVILSIWMKISPQSAAVPDPTHPDPVIAEYGYRVIIAGSRTTRSAKILETAIEESGFLIRAVVSGCAVGVDRLGERWAILFELPLHRYPANWDKYGRGAGLIRNREMAKFGQALIAVWDGQSSGTRHMIETMRGLDKPVFVYNTAQKACPQHAYNTGPEPVMADTRRAGEAG